MNEKDFLITVDTEGDNSWKKGDFDYISTENSKFIPRFQEMCEKFGFKPVYLTNYEMAKNKNFMKYLKSKQDQGECEIGLHIHAWNNPPEYTIKNVYGENPYITEYPYDTMLKKVQNTKNVIEQETGTEVLSHRSGRWALSENYIEVLAECGITIDCTVTPGLDLSALPGRSCKHGNNYKNYPKTPYYIHPQILEVPMTTRRYRQASKGSFKHRLKSLITKEDFWLRPIYKSIQPLEFLTKKVEKEKDCKYLEFMIHSSELMPGVNTYFKTEEDVEKLYAICERYFEYVSQLGYQGKTLKEYSGEFKK